MDLEITYDEILNKYTVISGHLQKAINKVKIYNC